MNTPHPIHTPYEQMSGNTTEYSGMYSEWGGEATMTPIPGENELRSGAGGTTPTSYIQTPNYSGATSSPDNDYRTPIYDNNPNNAQVYSPGQSNQSPAYQVNASLNNAPGYSPNHLSANSPSYHSYAGGINSPSYSPTANRNDYNTHISPQYSSTTNNFNASPNYSPTTPNYQSPLTPSYAAPAGTNIDSASSPLYNPTSPAYSGNNYNPIKKEVKKEPEEEF